jgi:hypothetical protein
MSCSPSRPCSRLRIVRVEGHFPLPPRSVASHACDAPIHRIEALGGAVGTRAYALRRRRDVLTRGGVAESTVFTTRARILRERGVGRAKGLDNRPARSDAKLGGLACGVRRSFIRRPCFNHSFVGRTCVRRRSASACHAPLHGVEAPGGVVGTRGVAAGTHAYALRRRRGLAGHGVANAVIDPTRARKLRKRRVCRAIRLDNRSACLGAKLSGRGGIGRPFVGRTRVGRFSEAGRGGRALPQTRCALGGGGAVAPRTARGHSRA